MMKLLLDVEAKVPVLSASNSGKRINRAKIASELLVRLIIIVIFIN
jgi:hypothetical protein